MKRVVTLLMNGFESSSQTTPEFKSFCTIFRNDFKKELQSIGATDIEFSRGHFYISGFFKVYSQTYYFSLPDVRDFGLRFQLNPNSCMNQLLYRTAKDNRDYTGGANQYVKIETGMAQNMNL